MTMKLDDLSFAQLIGAGAVLLLLLGIYNTIMTAVKNHIEAKKRNSAPVDDLKTKVAEHDKMLNRDKQRLDEIEDRLSSIRKESSMTLRGVRALLSHEINGNSIEKLQEANSKIDIYLENKE